jgi:hypothetical protein
MVNKKNKGVAIRCTRSKTHLVVLTSKKIIKYKRSKEIFYGTNYNGCWCTSNVRHMAVTVKLQLLNDIEVNPGPSDQASGIKSGITIVSQNCRGLGSIDKTRLLLNKIYALPRRQILVVMLQETMIASSRYLELAWRGKFVQTAGTGNSQGCVTLVNYDCEISEEKHYGNRGHHFTLTTCTGVNFKICNIYAPNGFDMNKNAFFETVFQDLSNWNGNLVLGGDFNTTLSVDERHHRSVTAAELRTAEIIKVHTNALNLNDSWDGKAGFTWRKGHSKSRLDRIYTRLDEYNVKGLNVTWTLTTSDHAGLVLTMEHQHLNYQRNEHVKLDNSVVQNKDTLSELITYLNEQMPAAINMDPHLRLEYAKMTVRTKALEIMARCKRKENERLREIDNLMKENMRLQTIYTDPQSNNILTIELEELTTERNALLCKQGEVLAQRAKTKWYNEGERSNKYFLNLLKRNNESSEMKSLTVNGVEIEDSTEIRAAVTDFYQQLYNKDESTRRCDDNFLDLMFRVDEMADMGMAAPVTISELWSALKPTKATTPGPDGLSNTYLKKLWGILGPLILDAWNHSLQTGMLPPSHKTSFLRLIPKAGKDCKLLKNWRPITLSNCDHKLITRLYNNRLLNVISNKISEVQTAYIKGRSIGDNLRLLQSVSKLPNYEENIDATIIALDAQKAFDSVSHDYIVQVLERVGLTSLVPIFWLLYKDLENDILINGRIGKGYKIKNGVKQGDALSCSLFILAMEPLIRNITENGTIQAVHSQRLNFTWPKLVAYADDITILTHNRQEAVAEIFTEYHRLTRASGLVLNADKTEKFDIFSRNVGRPMRQLPVRYGEQGYTLVSQENIKLNGIIFNRDVNVMRQANFDGIMAKMKHHFTEWGRRSLSLLGKIQIIKTFGISQYLYALAVMDIEPEHWKMIHKEIQKFLWNKGYSAQANVAPHRISRDIIYTQVGKGGLGMIRLEQVMLAARLRRYAYLMSVNNHPVARLQRALGGGFHLKRKAALNIDDVTDSTLKLLREHLLRSYAGMTGDYIEGDLLMLRLLLGCQLRDVASDNKIHSIEMNMLRRRGLTTVREVVIAGRENMQILERITSLQLKKPLAQIRRAYSGLEPPDSETGMYLFNPAAKQWLRPAQLTSKQIRLCLWEDRLLTHTKLLRLSEDSALRFYNKLDKLKNVQNKSKLLRLLHGDMYCGAKLYRYNLTDTDRCIRCFAEENVSHLLYECPYTREVWGRLGVFPSAAADILDEGLTKHELEIRAELISHLVFRKKTLPPEVLIRSVITNFRKGLSRSKGLKEHAVNMVERYELTGQWFT